MLAIALAVLLAPLVVGSSANAASILDEGTASFKDSAGNVITIVAKAVKQEAGCSQDACATVLWGLSKAPVDYYIAGASLQAQTNPINLWDLRHWMTPDECSSAGFPGCDAAQAWAVQSPKQGDDAGLICMGVIPAGADTSPGHSGTLACNYSDARPVTDPMGHPRGNGLDLGHKGQPGVEDPNTLPGQQEDGTVDLVACMGDNFGDFNPIGWVLAPIKCTWLWAMTPPRSMVPDLVKQQTDLWNSTVVGKTVNSVDFFDAFQPDEDCTGINLPISKIKVPGGPTPDDAHLLAACDGSRLAPMASLVHLGLTFAVLVGGAFKVVRMITAFVKGPQLEEPDPNGAVMLF